MKLEQRVRIKGIVKFKTAFHLGSGEGGSGASDMGVLTDHMGKPMLPGSSLKGVFRSTSESLAGHLGMRTCYLDRQCDWCAGASQDLGKKRLKELEDASIERIEEILNKDLCDTCRLFGSNLAQGKLWFQDAPVINWAGALELRDGVGIDRDSGTAVQGVKYNYEAVPAGATFDFELTGENLSSRELALLAVVVQEWGRGMHLGGMTSRGFGAAVLENVTFEKVELTDPGQRLQYLLEGKMSLVPLDELTGNLKAELEASHA